MGERLNKEENVGFKEYQELYEDFNLELNETGYKYKDIDLKTEREIVQKMERIEDVNDRI